jgi:hypothetical protein
MQSERLGIEAGVQRTERLGRLCRQIDREEL